MNRAELYQKIMEDICVPQYFSNYTDPATLLSILEDMPDDKPAQEYLYEMDVEDSEIWEPFENYDSSALYNSMDTLADSIIDFLIENDMTTVISLRR